MTPKRGGQDDGQDSGSRADETPTFAQTLRAGESVAAHQAEKKEEERMSLFWRVFGGTILSIVALIAITLFNNMMTSITDLRSEIAKANEARSAAVLELRTEMAKAGESKSELVRKEDYNSRMNSYSERVQAIQQQNSLQNATLTSQRTEIDGLKERIAKVSLEADAAKKDIAALELVKERIALLLADLKSARDEHQKLRADVDKNQAYDLERKESRDKQYKQIDDSFKELNKAIQDCREKLARLEGQYGPPSLVQPKKASSLRTTPIDPKEPEKAPLPKG